MITRENISPYDLILLKIEVLREEQTTYKQNLRAMLKQGIFEGEPVSILRAWIREIDNEINSLNKTFAQ